MKGIKHYLFDWGDTLMVDLPNQTGPMCDWPKVEVVAGALECLKHLSKSGQCHLATNAEDSSEIQIRQALQKAGLSDYIQQIFCRENLGVGKTEPEYFTKIVDKLNTPAKQIMMTGDSLDKDVYPALKVGLKAVWFNPKGETLNDIVSINSLSELII